MENLLMCFYLVFMMVFFEGLGLSFKPQSGFGDR